MRISFRAFIGAGVASGWLALRAVAQDAPASPAAPQTNPPPVVAPSAEKTAPAPKKAAAKPRTKKAEAQVEPKLEPVLQPEPGVSRQNNVNVRGQASINSEVIGHLQKNEPITVLEAITLKKPKQDEPARWYRISLPTNVTVWVNTGFIDESTKTVKPRRLNMRGGPGENYSILGRLERGTAVNPVETKGEWTRIETPTNAFGFVAAHLVERTPAPAIVAAPKTEPVTPIATNPPPQIAEVATAPAPAAPASPVATPAPVPATPETPATPAVTPAPAEVLPDAAIEKVKKIVSREGVLKGSVSIQAPTYYELRSLDTGKTIDYVFSPSTNLVLKQLKGKRIIVTGEELLDERWQNTPVLVVDALQTVP